jgi:hypothetical protein
MMSRVDQGLSPTAESEVDPLTGTVLASSGDGSTSSSTSSSTSTSKSGKIVVRNGSGASGIGSTVTKRLTAEGYTVSDTGNADSFNYTQTLVIYSNSSQADEAKAIANTVGYASAQINDGTYSLAGDFLVIIGSNYPTDQTLAS